jgi:hypothetical protein
MNRLFHRYPNKELACLDQLEKIQQSKQIFRPQQRARKKGFAETLIINKKVFSQFGVLHLITNFCIHLLPDFRGVCSHETKTNFFFKKITELRYL